MSSDGSYLVFILTGYAFVIAVPVAIIAFGFLRSWFRFKTPGAVASSTIIYAALVVPPFVGLAFDQSRYPTNCGSGRECYDWILWVVGMVGGWVLAALVAAALITVGFVRRSKPATPSTIH